MLTLHRSLLPFAFSSALAGVSSAATPISGVTTFGTSPTLAVSPTGAANGAGLLASNVFGYDIRLTTQTSSAVALYVEDLAYGQGNGVDYIPSNVSVVSMLSFAVSANNDDRFDMKSVDMSLSDMTGTSSTMSVIMTGYRDGVLVSGATSTLTFSLQVAGSTTEMAHFDVSANPAFQGIDEFRLAPASGYQIGYFGIDNLNATNFQPAPEASTFALLGSGLCFATLRRRRS